MYKLVCSWLKYLWIDLSFRSCLKAANSNVSSFFWEFSRSYSILALVFALYLPCICHVFALYLPCICLVFALYLPCSALWRRGVALLNIFWALIFRINYKSYIAWIGQEISSFWKSLFGNKIDYSYRKALIFT